MTVSNARKATSVYLREPGIYTEDDMVSSVWFVVFTSALLPPAGLVLLWLRSGIRLKDKIMGSTVIAVWSVAYLMFFFGLRFPLDGSGMRPVPTFGSPEAHYAQLERSRSQQSAPSAVVEAAAKPETKTESKPAAEVPSSAYWTDFRGPNRDGNYAQAAIRTDWPEKGLPLLWRQPVGGGYASFVIAGGRAFTIEQRRRQEIATAYDMATGREQWANAWDAEFQEAMGGDGPRATPTWNEGRVYALGATGELRCLDAATGKRIWSRNILKDNHAENLTWGMSAAPLIVDEKVIVLPGGTAGQSVAAYNKLTGEPIWKALDDKQAYTSPMLVTLAGKRQILVVSGKRIMGLTVENGSLIWEYPWTTEYDINSAQPLVLDENRVFISAGYGHGSAVLEITPAGVKSIWANNRMKNKFSSSVLYEGTIYGLDEAILACINTETGELKWKGGRYGYGQLLLAGGNLVVTTETGDVVLVKATPESHQELARFHAVSGKTWNNPAISDGLLLVRNETEMACFRLKF
jgi:outer membrane protein assembly factor BamB